MRFSGRIDVESLKGRDRGRKIGREKKRERERERESMKTQQIDRLKE